jgi:hypothetical protein
MARWANDGMIRVYYAATVSNKAAPTVAEANAGTSLSNFITKDGVNTPATQNMVDNASLAETYDAQVPGSFGGPITFTGIRDNATDTFWNLITYNLTGYILIRRGVATATAWTIADKVEVYPVQFHEPLPLPTASNEQGRFTVQAAVTSQPNLKAVMA